jgi:hypothetical protein
MPLSFEAGGLTTVTDKICYRPWSYLQNTPPAEAVKRKQLLPTGLIERAERLTCL